MTADTNSPIQISVQGEDKIRVKSISYQVTDNDGNVSTYNNVDGFDVVTDDLQA